MVQDLKKVQFLNRCQKTEINNTVYTTSNTFGYLKIRFQKYT